MKDDFSRSSLIIFVLTTTASAINYLCQIIMGRTMSLEAFGVINAIYSFILVASVPGTTFNLLAAKYIAEQHKNFERSSAVVHVMLRYAAIISLILLPLCLIAKPLMTLILGSNDFLVIFITILVVCVGYLYAILSGALSGMKKFVLVGLISLILPIFKVLGIWGSTLSIDSSVQLIILLCMMLVGSCFTAYAGLYLNKKNGIQITFIKKDAEKTFLLGRIGIATLICNLIFIFFSNLDVLSMNALFGSKESGLYSSTMLFGRIIFYIVTALVTVMLPFVSSAYANKGSPRTILKKTLIFTMIFILICIIPINIAPKFFLNLIYGGKYLQAAKYVPYTSIIAITVSLLNIAINYLIGIGRFKTLIITLCIGFVSAFGSIYLFHSKAEYVLLSISVVLAILTFVNIRNCLYSNERTGQID